MSRLATQEQQRVPIPICSLGMWDPTRMRPLKQANWPTASSHRHESWSTCKAIYLQQGCQWNGNKNRVPPLPPLPPCAPTPQMGGARQDTQDLRHPWSKRTAICKLHVLTAERIPQRATMKQLWGKQHGMLTSNGPPPTPCVCRKRKSASLSGLCDYKNTELRA